MVARLCNALRWPVMPWQRDWANVALELDPVTLEWVYPTVILIVQRQAGKTTVTGATGVHRAITGEDRGIWYTAQRRQDARDNWMMLVKRLRRSPIKDLMRIRESNGSETIAFPTGSEFRIFAPVEDALHGKPTDLVMVDEGWAFDEVRGDELTQAIIPTFTTRPGQMMIMSAAGTSASTWLMSLRDTGRMMVDAGRRDTVCYTEYGIADDVDPTDLGAVALAHPGYGYTLRPSGLIHAATTMKAGEFARAYGSRWTGAAERAIPALLWMAGPDQTTPVPGRGGFALGFEVGLDGADAAIAFAWRDPGGRAHVEIARVGPDATWVAGALVELVLAHDPVAVGYDRYGPATAVADIATRAGVETTPATLDDYVTACSTVLMGLADGSVKYRPHPALDDAAGAAVKRYVGDRWVWGRRASGSTIAPLSAATIALWAYDHAPTRQPFAIG